jgi:hypothetical protein
MLNYDIKNLKRQFTPNDGEQTLLTRDSTKDTVVVGGQVCNLNSTVTAFFTLILYDTTTEDKIYLFNNINIDPLDYLTVGKINLNPNQVIIVSTGGPTENNAMLDITLNYFEAIDYNQGFVKISFLPVLIFNNEPINPIPYEPNWRVVGTSTWYNADEYVPLTHGNCDIEFFDNPGYISPQNINIDVIKMKVIEIEVTYQLADSIVVFTCEQIDIESEFGWKVIDGDRYFGHNDFVIVSTGIQEIVFKDINGFITPSSIINTFESGVLYQYKINYGRESGSITVNIDPPNLVVGKIHQQLHEWYIIFPDGSITNYYTSGDSLDLLVAEGEYELVILSSEYYEPSSNNIKFTIETDQKITMNISMEPL